MNIKRDVVSGAAIGLGITPELIGTSYVYTDREAARIIACLRENPAPRLVARRRRPARAALA